MNNLSIKRNMDISQKYVESKKKLQNIKYNSTYVNI